MAYIIGGTWCRYGVYSKGNLRMGKTEEHLKKLQTLADNAKSVGLDVRMIDKKKLRRFALIFQMM